MRPLLDGAVFEPLRDPAYFASVKLDSFCGTVVWPNGADFAPEASTIWRQKPCRGPRPDL